MSVGEVIGVVHYGFVLCAVYVSPIFFGCVSILPEGYFGFCFLRQEIVVVAGEMII